VIESTSYVPQKSPLIIDLDDQKKKAKVANPKDVDGDGVVDGADYNVWLENFGSSSALPASLSFAQIAVPEPPSVWVLVPPLVGFVFVIRRWREHAAF